MKIDITGHFINKHQGGWRDLPKDIERYACTMSFFDTGNLEMERHWSLVINMTSYNYETGKFSGQAHFLADSLPNGLIRLDKSIELYEGPRFVGHAVILNII